MTAAAESLRLGFAFTLGTFTFFAPCAFPLLPGYVAFFVGREGGGEAPGSPLAQVRRAAVVGLLASLGVLLVFAVLAAVAAAVGTQLLTHVTVLEGVVGVVLVGVGAAMALGRLDPGAVHVPLPERRRGPLAYVLFGVVYAGAAAGCTAWMFIGVATIALTSGPVGAVAVFGAYAAGMVLLLVGVTLLAALGRGALLRHVTRRTDRLTRVAGVVLVLAGLVQLYFFVVVFDGLAPLVG